MADDRISSTKPEAAGAGNATRATIGGTITERGWDGWPTKPTPNYLIPKMGEVPVSSTVHFQTVVMTSLKDTRLTAKMWSKIKVPVITALRQKKADAANLQIIKAVYGDFPREQTEFPSTNPFDVSDKIRKAKDGLELAILVDNAQFGDPAFGVAKTLRVYFRVGRDRIVREASEGSSLRFSAKMQIVRATYGKPASEDLSDVTEMVRAKVTDNALKLTVASDVFNKSGDGDARTLKIEYTIHGESRIAEFADRDEAQIGGELYVERAYYGDLPAIGSVDVTETLSVLVKNGKLAIDVENSLLGFDPAWNAVKHLHVKYREGGIRLTRVVSEHSHLMIGTNPEAVDATAVHNHLFETEPHDVDDLAHRLASLGLTAEDLDPDAEFMTLTEWLNLALGVAENEKLDPASFADADALDEPAQGVILYHEQGWYARGMSLGNLLHSVALAPGEVTQVAMTHWNHSTRATDEEMVSQVDTSSATDMQKRAVAEVQNSAVRAHEWGSSAAQSSADSFAAGTSSITAKASLGFFGSIKGSIEGNSTSFGSSHNISTAVTQSAGDKNVSMAANQDVNAATRRRAEAVRNRRSSVVREVTQNEDETITTRVVANYNHMHALTVMYFEVIEIFSLRTRVVDAERIIFLPYVVRDVVDLIPKYASVMIDAANAAERPDLALAIRHYRENPDGTDSCAAAIKRITASRDKASEAIIRLRKEITELPDKRSSIRVQLQHALETLTEKRAAFIQGLATFKDVPDVFGSIASQALHGQLQPIEAEITQINANMDSLRSAEQQDRGLLDAELAENKALLDRFEEELRVFEHALELGNDLKSRNQRGPFHENRLFFNQAVWLSLAPSEVLGLVMRRNRFNGEKISEQIDPTPVALSGNYVAYRWRLADPLASQQFKRQYVHPFIGDPEQELATVTADVAVPAGGVFAEAVLGEAVSAEKIDLSRFWNWQDSMIPILPTSINPISAATPQRQDLDPKADRLDESSARLDQLKDLPAPSGFAALAQTTQAQMFRDMSGQEMLKTLATATTTEAAQSERNAAQTASNNLKAGLDFMKDMADKAVKVAAASETGGASLLGGMVKSNGSSGASLLGGVLNAKDAGGNGDVLAKLTGGKQSIADVATAIGGATGGSGGTSSSGGGNADAAKGSNETSDTNTGGSGSGGLPPEMTEKK